MELYFYTFFKYLKPLAGMQHLDCKRDSKPAFRFRIFEVSQAFLRGWFPTENIEFLNSKNNQSGFLLNIKSHFFD